MTVVSLKHYSLSDGHRILIRAGSTTAIHPVNRLRSVFLINSSINLLTDNGPKLLGLNRIIPGWLPGGYFLRSPNSISSVSNILSSALAAEAIMVSDCDRSPSD